MIKFYKDDLSAMVSLTGAANAICFATDRGTLFMGGKEYGRDAYSVHVEPGNSTYSYQPTGARAIKGADVASGTLYAVPENNSIWMYNGNKSTDAERWTNVITGTCQASDFAVGNKADGTISTAVSGGYIATVQDVINAATNLETKTSGAYAAGTALSASSLTDGTNNIIVSKDGGIQKTEYTLDHNTAATVATITDTSTAASGKASLSSVIPNAQTLAYVYEDVKKKAVSISNSEDRVITFTSAYTDGNANAGTTWTPEFHIASGADNASALVIENGTLGVKLAIRQKATAEGYLATYGLFNEAAGQANGVQLGDNINLVKDQFLKKAQYVKAVTINKGTNTEATIEKGSVTSSNVDDVKAALDITDPSVNADSLNTGNTYDNYWGRFLKLTFALTDESKEPSGASDDQTVNPSGKASSADSVIYIDVNELFDSYTGISGVAVNKYTNQISGVVAPTGNTVLTNNETGDTGTGKRGAHYQSAFLTVAESGFAISGIKQEITAYIQDLSGITASGVANVTTDASTYSATGDSSTPVYPVYLTEVTVGTDGKLSGTASGINATGVKFNGFSGNVGGVGHEYTVPTGSVAQALSSIGAHIDSLEYGYDGIAGSGAITKPSDVTGDTAFIYAITQVNGQIATSAMTINSKNLTVSAFASPALTGIPVAAAQKIYTINNTGTGTGSLQSGLETIVSSVYDAINAMSAAITGSAASLISYSGTDTTQTAYQIINTIKQDDGTISATTVALDADHVTFGGIGSTTADYIALTGKVGNTSNVGPAVTVGAALSSISKYIAESDLATVGQVGTTVGDVGNGSNQIYKVINQVGQVDGRVTAVTMDLTDGNVAATPVAEVAPTGAGESNTDVVRAAVTGTNVKQQIDSISNTLADYLSFHNAAGKVIN